MHLAEDKKKKEQFKVETGKVFIPGEAFERAIGIVNTYGNKKTKLAFERLVAAVNSNSFGPILVSAEIEVKEDEKKE